MSNQISDNLKKDIPQIMNNWEQRALEEVKAAHHQERLALRDSLPEYLEHLAKTLAQTSDCAGDRGKLDKKITSIAKKHGEDRASDFNYTMDQLILEYHILRQTIFDELEQDSLLSPIETEIIICAIEKAVSDAATEFSDILNSRTAEIKVVTRLTEKLSEALKARDEFLSIASHELKTPISSLMLQMEMALRNLEKNKNLPPRNESLKTVFASAIKQSKQLAKLVEDLLSVSMVHSGKLEIHTELEIDISSLVQAVIDRTGATVPIHFQPPSTPIRGQIDCSRIEQVVTNLISNAIKYGDNKAIVVDLRLAGKGWAEISVKDAGPGIKLEDQERIFERFERIASKDSVNGLGLGLYISQQILTAHGGRIRVESAIGQGSNFIALIPLSQSL
jgi:signal transduction histidine kinase